MPPKKKGQAAGPGAAAAGVSDDAARDLILGLRAGTVSAEEKRRLALADAGPCDGACKANTKANPSCFCGWVPAEGSFRKKGLWQKEPALLAGLGADPRAALRQVRPHARGRHAAGHGAACGARRGLRTRPAPHAHAVVALPHARPPTRPPPRMPRPRTRPTRAA